MNIFKTNIDVDQIIEYESGQMTQAQEIAFFQMLLSTGMVWKLQGHYGRTAESMLTEGLIKEHSEDEAFVLHDLQNAREWGYTYFLGPSGFMVFKYGKIIHSQTGDVETLQNRAEQCLEFIRDHIKVCDVFGV